MPSPVNYRIAQDKYHSEYLSKPPLTAFRRQNNLRNHLIKSNLPPPPRPYPERNKTGMSNYGKTCPTCPYIIYGNKVRIYQNTIWMINKKITYESFNVVYLLEGQKENCHQRYIGTTGHQLKYRMADHRGYITNQVTSKATGAPGTCQATAWQTFGL